MEAATARHSRPLRSDVQRWTDSLVTLLMLLLLQLLPPRLPAQWRVRTGKQAALTIP